VNSVGFTAHASLGLQQRSIPTFVIELLERCGSERRCHEADRLFFDKSAKKRLRKHLGGERAMQLVEKWLNVYAVVGDNDHIVTVAHKRNRRG
jgi:hypothetical protein